MESYKYELYKRLLQIFADTMSPSHLLSVDTRESADSVAKMAFQYAEEAHLGDNDII